MGHGAASAPSSVFTFAGRLHLLGHGERDEQNVNAPSAAMCCSQPAPRAAPMDSGVQQNGSCPHSPPPAGTHRWAPKAAAWGGAAQQPALPWPPGAILRGDADFGTTATTKGLGGDGEWGAMGDDGERAALSPGPPHPFLPAAARCSAPSSAPSHHCGSADGSSVTSLFLPPCFDPAVLIVQANPTPSLGCQPELLLMAQKLLIPATSTSANAVVPFPRSPSRHVMAGAGMHFAGGQPHSARPMAVP